MTRRTTGNAGITLAKGRSTLTKVKITKDRNEELNDDDTTGSEMSVANNNNIVHSPPPTPNGPKTKQPKLNNDNPSENGKTNQVTPSKLNEDKTNNIADSRDINSALMNRQIITHHCY